MQRQTKKQRRKLRQDGIIDAEGRFRKNVLSIDSSIEPITETQEAAFEAHEEGYNLMLLGSAGTGKSFLSLYFALSEVIKPDCNQKKVIVIRSAVPSRDIGFEPGTKSAKESLYESPYPPLCNKVFARNDAYQLLKSQGMIEFTSTSHLRSLTYDDAYIVVDEVQNMNFEELDTVITRAGKNTRIIFSGDTKQNDLTKKKSDQSGLINFMKIIENLSEFDMIEFTAEDVVRSGLVKSYLLQKEKMGY